MWDLHTLGLQLSVGVLVVLLVTRRQVSAPPSTSVR